MRKWREYRQFLRGREEQRNGISDENMKSDVGVLNQGPV